MSETHRRLAEAIENLAINYNRGAYHKPVALVWALERARSQKPRLARSGVARSCLDPLLSDLVGTDANAAWPWLKLANDLEGMWVVDDADPEKDPPASFVAGWNRAAYEALSREPAATSGLVDQILGTHLSDVRGKVADALGIGPRESAVEDTVVVAAKVAYDEYLRYSAYICQPRRTFREIDYMAFYRAKRIEPLIPRILFEREVVLWDEGVAADLSVSENPEDRHIGELMKRVIADRTERSIGNEYKVMVLSAPDADETVRLDAPLAHVAPNAWVQGQRYASSRDLRMATTTDDLA